MAHDGGRVLARLASRRLAARAEAPGALLASLSAAEFEAHVIRFEQRLLLRRDPAQPLAPKEEEARSRRIQAGLAAIGPDRTARVYRALLGAMRARGEGVRADAFEARLQSRGFPCEGT